MPVPVCCVLCAAYFFLLPLQRRRASHRGYRSQRSSLVGKEEFLSLLDISTGEPVDAETVRSGIKRAFLKGIFEDIAVEIIEGEKAKAVIRVKERDYIQRIDISGRFRSLQKDDKSVIFAERRADPHVRHSRKGG